MLPWVSMEVTPIGTYRPCCLYSESIPNVSVHAGHTIADAQNSEYMKDLRQQFLDGKKPAGCNMCWQEESVPGRMSKRKATFIKLKNVKPKYNEASVTPIFLDLKLGNICNLKCRICGSWSSSKWAQEEIDLAGGDNELAKQQLKSGQWPRRITSWWDALEDALPFIEYLEFTGGEPFLILEHFELLEKLVERRYASKIDIHYNTNGTIWPTRVETLWTHFKRVEIAFSIDDIGSRFEYQRYGARWNETEEVIRKAVASKFSLQVCTTFNIQNAYYWAETEDWIYKQGIRDIHFNILQEPPMFNLRNMPWDIKGVFELQMQRAKNKRINEVIQFMALEGDNMLPALRERLDKSDKYRKQSFAETHPEVWDLIYDR
jgi:MoaA/NifB/PqqE/SkfB family radical SAM enzyme